jgi:hypothetical protein
VFPIKLKMKITNESYLSQKKGKAKKYFTTHKKVDRRVYLFVLIVYAIFGLQSVLETIFEGSGAYLKERYSVSNSKIVIVNEVVAKEVEEKKENVTCEDWAEEFGGSNVDLIIKIIKAESGNNPLAKNGVSSASGCMQFINGTWHEQGLKLWGDDFYQKNIWNPRDNVELGSHLIAKGELQRWEESKSVWNN